MLAGQATAEGTLRYTTRHPLPAGAVRLGTTGLTVSPLGFGGYRVDDQTPAHREALKLALQFGCNLIDTSANYTDGGSERLIGEVLNDLVSHGELARDEVIVVSKAGYVQGSNLDLARARIEEGHPFPEMVKYSSDCWHCISPEFLALQLTRSLSRLQLAKLDVLLLHNPEYFLMKEGDHREYYRRIRQAFEHLETEVARGRITCYGVSSNTFPVAKDAPAFTSLEVLLEIAREISPEHHFKAIEFPFNLFEPGAALEANNSGKTLLETAHEASLATLVNRPLNAFRDGKLVRLADLHDPGDHQPELEEAFSHALQLESHYAGETIVPASQIAWAHILRDNFGTLGSLDHWRGLMAFRIRPSLGRALEKLSSDPSMLPWVEEYRFRSDELFEHIASYLQHQAAKEAQRITQTLETLEPTLRQCTSLSQKSIAILRSFSAGSCILVGMRAPTYVRDILALRPVAASSPADIVTRLRSH